MICVVASKDDRFLLGDFVNRVTCEAQLDSWRKKLRKKEIGLWLNDTRLIVQVTVGSGEGH
jgi:hypothetical protein